METTIKVQAQRHQTDIDYFFLEVGIGNHFSSPMIQMSTQQGMAQPTTLG